jgi:hypothetical protein
LFIAIPLLIMAGYCLDWSESKQQRIKSNRRKGGPAN